MTVRGRIIRLLDAHPWTTPRTISEARSLHATLAPVRDTAQAMHGHDRIAKLVPLRLDVFLEHWPEAPTSDALSAFREDAKGLCRHDIPRLRGLLAWSPSELPEQRTPRLGVASLNTA